MKHITIDELKQVSGEGLILQGCGGDPKEWESGINDMFTEIGILLDGDKFKDICIFEHDGLTNMLFSMENVKLDIGKLAMWRIESHNDFGGTWLSDYLPNKLDIDISEPNINEPKAKSPSSVVFEEPTSSNGDKVHSDNMGNIASDFSFRVYVENTHKPEYGGFTMPLPTTSEKLQPFLSQLEINLPQDMKILEVSSDIKGLDSAVTDAINKSESLNMLNELNYLAAKINSMQPDEYKIFSAALDAKSHCDSIAEIINITENINSFNLKHIFSAEQYGKYLIEEAKDTTCQIVDTLEQSHDPNERFLANYLMSLEDHVNETSYGLAVSATENGIFTDQGYLTETGEFKEIYYGAESIPSEFKAFVYPELIQSAKVENVDLSVLLLKIHALCGEHMSDAETNLNILADKRSAEYLLLMDGQNIFLTEANRAYCDGSEAHSVWLNSVENADTRVFAINVDTQYDKIIGDLVELDFNVCKSDILLNKIQYTEVNATLKDGSEKSYSPAEWDSMGNTERENIQSHIPVYKLGDMSSVVSHLEDILKEQSMNAIDIHSEILLSDINAHYMNKATNPQTEMLRIDASAAKAILARSDAAVFCLTSDGAKKMKPLDVTKSGTALIYNGCRQFAVKKDDFAGIDKWAKREVDILNSKHQQERETIKKPKSHGQEL